MDKRFDLLFTLIVLAFTLFYFYLIEKMPKIHLGDPLGPEGYPRIMAIGIGATAVMLLALQLRKWRKIPGRTFPPEGEADDPGVPVSHTRVVLLVLTVFLYLMVMPYIGYLLATPLFVAAVLRVTGVRKIKRLVAVPLAFTLVLYTIFGILARIRLPMGFMDFLNDLISTLFA